MFSNITVEVIDPLNRTGKVAIPSHLVHDTKGFTEYHSSASKRETKDYSLCLLFQKGRCNAGAHCHQIHACPEHVTKLREQAAACRHCCAEHGDMHSHGYNDATHTVVIADAATGSERHFPLAAFARTGCLDAVLRSVKASEVRIPSNKLCRLHSQMRCKFGKDCKNVHLCPDATELSAARGVDMSCGLSARSAQSSKPSSLNDSPARGVSPRETKFGGPLCIDADDSAAFTTTHHGCSSIFSETKDYVDRQVSSHMLANSGFFGSVYEESLAMSVELDMSAFEATIRNLCDDLDRAEHSPAAAIRVRSKSQLLVL